MNAIGKRLLAALFFALSLAMGLLVWDTLSGTKDLIPEQPLFLYFYIFAVIAVASVVLYIVGFIFSFLSSRKSGRLVSYIIGGASLIAVLLAIYVGYLSGFLAIWHLFAVPGLVGAISLWLVHRRHY